MGFIYTLWIYKEAVVFDKMYQIKVMMVSLKNNIYRKERIMEKKIVWLGIVVMVVGLCSSGALATTLGPPVAGLNAGQFSVGVEYSNSDVTLDLDGEMGVAGELVVDDVVVDSGDESESFKSDEDFESDMIFAKLGYGVSDKLEVFARLGMADLEAGGFSSSQEFAWGIGAKATFYEEAALKLGALIQMTWGSAEDDFTEDNFDDGDFPEPYRDLIEFEMPMEVDWYEIKVAVGPSYEFAEGVSVYGGPFYHMFRGDFDGDASQEIDLGEGGIANLDFSMSADIEEASQFGGYIGAQVDLAENLPVCVEYQFTSDANIFGAGLVYRF